MTKIQYGMAGFFAGAFLGLLLGLVERRFIDHEKNPAALFITIALTIIILGIIGMTKGLNIAAKKMKDDR